VLRRRRFSTGVNANQTRNAQPAFRKYLKNQWFRQRGCVILAHGGIYITVKKRFSGARRAELITKITIGEA